MHVGAVGVAIVLKLAEVSPNAITLGFPRLVLLNLLAGVQVLKCL